MLQGCVLSCILFSSRLFEDVHFALHQPGFCWHKLCLLTLITALAAFRERESSLNGSTSDAGMLAALPCM